MAKSTSTTTNPSESSEQDRTLVEQALAGNEAAFRKLMQKYDKALHHHIYRMVRTRGEVEDLVQESFIKAFSALTSYSSDYAFSTWLYKIATNHTIDYLRKKKLPTFSIDKPIQTKDGNLEYEVPDITDRVKATTSWRVCCSISWMRSRSKRTSSAPENSSTNTSVGKKIRCEARDKGEGRRGG